jgi:hypothetical protein
MLREAVYSVVILMLLAGTATAQPYGYSDAWSADYEEIEGTDTGLFWGFGMTEVDYGDMAGVGTDMLDPSSNMVNTGWNEAQQVVGLTLEHRVAESGPEGDFSIASDHYVNSGGGGWVLFAVTSLLVNVTNYATRYWYNASADLYYNWFCGNACQKSSAWIPMPGRPPYIQGTGKRIRILFYNYCRMGLYARQSTAGLACHPPN